MTQKPLSETSVVTYQDKCCLGDTAQHDVQIEADLVCYCGGVSRQAACDLAGLCGVKEPDLLPQERRKQTVPDSDVQTCHGHSE